jgi:hypothetical protein
MSFSTLLHKKGISTINGEKQAEEENTKDMNILARLPKTKSTNERIEKKMVGTMRNNNRLFTKPTFMFRVLLIQVR